MIAMRVLLLALLTCAASAQAQQPTQAQQNAIRQSCRSDYQARCSSVSPGGSAALQCLKDNMTNLSPACQSAVAATQSGGATTTRQAPTGAAPPPPPPAPAARSAPPPPPAPAARSAPPPPAMSPREEIALMRNACAGDFRAFCRGVPLGGGRALACLADHSESLSPPCRNALAAARGR